MDSPGSRLTRQENTPSIGRRQTTAEPSGECVVIASNGTPVVAPHGGYEPKFCTNPFCLGFPTNDAEQTVIWDISTSNIMYAQAKLAERLGTRIPEGSAYDDEGNATTDPLKALQGASGPIESKCFSIWPTVLVFLARGICALFFKLFFIRASFQLFLQSLFTLPR